MFFSGVVCVSSPVVSSMATLRKSSTFNMELIETLLDEIDWKVMSVANKKRAVQLIRLGV